MSFERRSELWTYDVFPKVVTAGKKVCIHIRPFGGRKFFEPGKEYAAIVRWLNGGTPDLFQITAYTSVRGRVQDQFQKRKRRADLCRLRR